MKCGLNIVFLGGFVYPQGMAGTKRVQHVINGLKQCDDVSVSVLVLRQSSKCNPLCGVYDGTPYQTAVGDLEGLGAALLIPYIFVKTRRLIRRLFRAEQSNVLYVYGPINYDNFILILYARWLGYRIVFDLVEDYDYASGLSARFVHKCKIKFIQYVLRLIEYYADGLIVISSHLLCKYSELSLPVYLLPISVDMDKFSNNLGGFNDLVTMFYAGSFGQKDGLPVLLEAFVELSEQYENIRLVLTGRGTDEDMAAFFSRLDTLPCRDRIIYKGYLGDDEYYRELNCADILCMTRIDTGYANAGFPFKLGEYLATGKPVIASAVSDIPHLIKNNSEALLVAPGESHAIVEAVNLLLKDETWALEIGARGRRIALQLFDYRSQGRLLYDFLRIRVVGYGKAS